ncbi:hypothetical protein BDK51DRAFT_43343 [Blyttiomyces helicus]|uniref:DNA-directed RNA polymerase n=2 Tax=Blyttiomyces helicus TaxID=388810 RepID=A0A4P9W579_9FUNG|nr:hypothetical protein BDK51DRAFT_43343 [Blyttiomyces helicus]|eukprot:RKO87102.1 hypothetical protein BDK51DRAFT_43343 [Blyttiomyces helicus]
MSKDENTSMKPLHPQEARLRNLTYSAPLYVDIRMETRKALNSNPQNRAAANLGEMDFQVTDTIV